MGQALPAISGRSAWKQFTPFLDYGAEIRTVLGVCLTFDLDPSVPRPASTRVVGLRQGDGLVGTFDRLGGVDEGGSSAIEL
jgi:hypothetical protein